MRASASIVPPVVPGREGARAPAIPGRAGAMADSPSGPIRRPGDQTGRGTGRIPRPAQPGQDRRGQPGDQGANGPNALHGPNGPQAPNAPQADPRGRDQAQGQPGQRTGRRAAPEGPTRAGRAAPPPPPPGEISQALPGRAGLPPGIDDSQGFPGRHQPGVEDSQGLPGRRQPGVDDSQGMPLRPGRQPGIEDSQGLPGRRGRQPGEGRQPGGEDGQGPAVRSAAPGRASVPAPEAGTPTPGRASVPPPPAGRAEPGTARGEQTGPRARFATGEFSRASLTGPADAGAGVRPVSPADDPSARPGMRRGGRHSGEFSQVQPREGGGRHSGEFTEVPGRHSGGEPGRASVPPPGEPPAGRHSGEFTQVQPRASAPGRASVAVPGEVSQAIPRHGVPEPTGRATVTPPGDGRATVTPPGDVSQAMPGRASVAAPAEAGPGRASVARPGDLGQAKPGRASVSVPGDVSQAMPGRATPPGDVSQAMPGRATPPGEAGQALPGRASVAVPSDVGQALPGRAPAVPQEEPDPDDLAEGTLLEKLRSQRRLRVGALIAASIVALILLPALVVFRSISTDPVYASLDSLDLPSWATTRVDDRSTGSRWCLEECKFRERTVQSAQETDPTAKAYTAALTSAGWQPWKVESCPDQPISDGKYSCWRRDEFTLDLWVRRPDCAVDAAAAQDPDAPPSLGPDGVVPTGPPKGCKGSTVSIKVQAAIADGRGKPQPAVDPSLVGETPDPQLPSDPLEPTPTQS
ncbi:hypothetical protein AB0M54_22240 [Actinoplanes sp. NPDC051470]|uniref:hypothetical protein n=1 Tax=Actinoplanes sp. NPDC051470 TaxID=3157224 RepID=UPI003424178B